MMDKALDGSAPPVIDVTEFRILFGELYDDIDGSKFEGRPQQNSATFMSLLLNNIREHCFIAADGASFVDAEFWYKTAYT
jgi:hypothetical protein